MPSPQGGGMVKAAWFRSYAANERPDKYDQIVQSWDTANKASELSDFSVCMSWGHQGKDLCLLGHELDSLAAPSFTDAHGMRRNLATTMLAVASVAGYRNLPPQLVL